ncbi:MULTISPECIES: heme/hemin ABC transporter substrate-binding protein [unclassified Gilliamella]|uniref:heme/hemin ABC transporter substrate-binding protein n=1 Tax=unclassified Gilliamella TaxID=2685620 RepID=UPI0013237AD6|nr:MULTISPECIES: ABC transporter substrate-binding protein [unclassified Gilliamella]MWN31183.1 ABC transporter substrate-binding protein [Gilliamella sp. Pra-s60]MWP29764.1 ABC transporter substrate-binding protein [Gilliamella sp. Pra-s54]MWP46889.1 ABC transporter substrate-binding protein [Gilliamella sp. Pas-s27]
MKKNFILKIGLFLFIFALNSFNNSFANERIVIAGGALTEIVFALGAGDQIVGVDKTSSYPDSVKKLPQIGYWKLLNIEGILSLKPTLFITLSDVEPDNIISQVNQAKVDVLSLQRVPGTLDLLYTNIEKIADKLNKQTQGQQLINKIKTNITKIQEKTNNHPNKAKVLFLMSMGGTNSVAGKNTTADALITIAGGENLAKHTSYKTYTAESLIAMNPEIIVLNKYSIEQLGGIEKLNTIAGITETSAFKNNRIITIDDSYLFGIGPRVDEVAQILYQHFYPK